MNKSLFQIEQEYMIIAQQLLENDGVPTEELAEALVMNEAQLQTKSTNYAFVIKQMDGECDIIDTEIKRLQGLKKSRQNASERLKSAISTAMEIYGVEEIKTPLVKLNFRKSESVEIEDQELLDKTYLVEKTTCAPDKTAIKEAIKRGETVNGAVLVTNKNLQIK